MMYTEIESILIWLVPIFVVVSYFGFRMTYKQIMQIFCFFLSAALIIGMKVGYTEVVIDICVLNGTIIIILLLGYLFFLKKKGVPLDKSLNEKERE